MVLQLQPAAQSSQIKSCVRVILSSTIRSIFALVLHCAIGNSNPDESIIAYDTSHESAILFAGKVTKSKCLGQFFSEFITAEIPTFLGPIV